MHARRLVTSRQNWNRLLTADENTTAWAGVPAITKTKPASTTGVGVVDTANYPLLRLIFAGTDAANETINFRIVGWQRYARGDGAAKQIFWLPRVLAVGVATLGTKTLGTDGADVESAAALLSDTIIETSGYDQATVFSPADNTVAWLDVQVGNCDLIEVDVDRGTAATSSVIYQLAEASAFLGGASGGEGSASGAPTANTLISLGTMANNSWTLVLAWPANSQDAYLFGQTNALYVASADSAPSGNKGSVLLPNGSLRVLRAGGDNLYVKNVTDGSNGSYSGVFHHG